MSEKDKEYWRRKKSEQRAKAESPEAWEIAMVRAERAAKYAMMFPEHVRPSEWCFSDPLWQYEHEGLPAVRSRRVGHELVKIGQ